jgi:hypothetical protein
MRPVVLTIADLGAEGALGPGSGAPGHDAPVLPQAKIAPDCLIDQEHDWSDIFARGHANPLQP